MLTVTVRKRNKEEKTGALRRAGFIPAIVYGPTIEAIPIVLERRDLSALFAQITRSTRIELQFTENGEGKNIDVYIKTIQYNPITSQPIHVDFYHPEQGHRLKLDVPVKIIGEALGVKNSGGILDQLLETIPVLGQPGDIPALITINVKDLQIGAAIRVQDIDFGKSEPLLPLTRRVVTILSPRRMEEVTVVAEEAAGKNREVSVSSAT
ncbi:50S ribosomal protein L25 [Candidatus Acetothermia bacterium]|nr:50S ribosomal protein L25 [Candidatus Acetothermia bacterium]